MQNMKIHMSCINKQLAEKLDNTSGKRISMFVNTYEKPGIINSMMPGKKEKRGVLNRGIWREDKQLVTPSFCDEV